MTVDEEFIKQWFPDADDTTIREIMAADQKLREQPEVQRIAAALRKLPLRPDEECLWGVSSCASDIFIGRYREFKKGVARDVAYATALAFEDLTGFEPGVTIDWDTGKAHGAFFNLLAEVFSILKVTGSAERHARAVCRELRDRPDIHGCRYPRRKWRKTT